MATNYLLFENRDRTKMQESEKFLEEIEDKLNKIEKLSIVQFTVDIYDILYRYYSKYFKSLKQKQESIPKLKANKLKDLINDIEKIEEVERYLSGDLLASFLASVFQINVIDADIVKANLDILIMEKNYSPKDKIQIKEIENKFKELAYYQ